MSETRAPGPGEIVLDLDGPILDVAARHFRVYRDIAADLGFSALPFETYWSQKRTPLGARRILQSTGSESFYAEFSQRWLREIELYEYLQIDSVQPGAFDVLHRWKARGHKLVLATMRQDAAALDRQLRALDLRAWFDSVVVCDRLLGAAGKAKSVSVRAGPALPVSYWIGDTEVDIAAARERGSVAWALSCGLRDAEFLASKSPDRLSAYLADVDLGTG